MIWFDMLLPKTEFNSPIADAHVLEDLIVAVLEAEIVRRLTCGRMPSAVRRRHRRVGQRVETAETERRLVRVVDVVVGPEQVTLCRRLVLDVVERAGVVVESADRNWLSEDRSDASTRVMLPPTASPPLFARNVISGPLVFFVLIVGEAEQTVLENRGACPSTGVAEV